MVNVDWVGENGGVVALRDYCVPVEVFLAVRRGGENAWWHDFPPRSQGGVLSVLVR